MDDICLKLPLKSEFVLIARLVSSGYSARLGLDIEKTEDIKVVISEILNKCILAEKTDDQKIDIDFSIWENHLVISFKLDEIEEIVGKNGSDDLGYAIIQTLCDKFEFVSSRILKVRFVFKEDK